MEGTREVEREREREIEGWKSKRHRTEFLICIKSNRLNYVEFVCNVDATGHGNCVWTHSHVLRSHPRHVAHAEEWKRWRRRRRATTKKIALIYYSNRVKESGRERERKWCITHIGQIPFGITYCWTNWTFNAKGANQQQQRRRRRSGWKYFLLFLVPCSPFEMEMELIFITQYLLNFIKMYILFICSMWACRRTGVYVSSTTSMSQ